MNHFKEQTDDVPEDMATFMTSCDCDTLQLSHQALRHNLGNLGRTSPGGDNHRINYVPRRSQPERNDGQMTLSEAQHRGLCARYTKPWCLQDITVVDVITDRTFITDFRKVNTTPTSLVTLSSPWRKLNLQKKATTTRYHLTRALLMITFKKLNLVRRW